MNDYVFRYTDVMLMRAEALIELGQLEEARTIINDIRERAANSIDKHISYARDFCQIALLLTLHTMLKLSTLRYKVIPQIIALCAMSNDFVA